MCKSVGVLLLAFWAFSVCRVSDAAAVEAVPLPPQVPSHTPSGAPNLTDVWLHNGGGRLYWNTLVTPRQIALEGARFVDPASVPELALTPKTAQKPPVRHASRRVKVAKAAPHAATTPSPAPKDVGKTSLQPPVSQSSAIQPMSSAAPVPAKSGNAVAAPARAGGVAPAPSSDAMPYSSVAPSPVGGIGGGVAGNPAVGVPAPPSFTAEDVLPRANARP